MGGEPRVGPSDEVRICAVEPLGFRNLHHSQVALGERLTVIHGPNGGGKTNLLEAIYFGLTSHSCRGGDDRDLITHGESAARVELTLARSDGRHELLTALGRDGERRQLLDDAGAAGAGAAGAEARPLASVFLPDRLQIVKGAPAHRRAHLDRVIAALWPARGDLRSRFGRALAQRNALVARVRGGLASTESLTAWDEQLVAEAEPLTTARSEAVELLAQPFSAAARDLGLPSCTIEYRPRAPLSGAELLEELARRRADGLGRAYTSFGPQLDEIAFELEGRSLRRFGSQGQQRLTLLSLLISERELLIAVGRPAPLMLLDDVMSELDGDHRRLLIERLGASGQAVITAAEPDAVPRVVPWSSLAMRDGRVSGIAVDGSEGIEAAA